MQREICISSSHTIIWMFLELLKALMVFNNNLRE